MRSASLVLAAALTLGVALAPGSNPTGGLAFAGQGNGGDNGGGNGGGNGGNGGSNGGGNGGSNGGGNGGSNGGGNGSAGGGGAQANAGPSVSDAPSVDPSNGKNAHGKLASAMGNLNAAHAFQNGNIPGAATNPNSMIGKLAAVKDGIAEQLQLSADLGTAAANYDSATYVDGQVGLSLDLTTVSIQDVIDALGLIDTTALDAVQAAELQATIDALSALPDTTLGYATVDAVALDTAVQGDLQGQATAAAPQLSAEIASLQDISNKTVTVEVANEVNALMGITGVVDDVTP